MTNEKPHYIYIARQPVGFSLVVMTKKQETLEQPLTVDSALKFAGDFMTAARELHKQEITRLGNKERQEDMFHGQVVHPSGERSSDHPEARSVPPIAPI